MAPPARAQDVDAEIAAAADDLTPIQGRTYAKIRNGHRQVAGQIMLADPIADAGRMIDRVDVMQEWDCKTGRYRITRAAKVAAPAEPEIPPGAQVITFPQK